MTGAHPNMLPHAGQESRYEHILPLNASPEVKKCLMRYGPIGLDTIGLVRSCVDWPNYRAIQRGNDVGNYGPSFAVCIQYVQVNCKE